MRGVEALAALCAAGLLAVACGSDDSAVAPADESAGAETTSDNRPPVVDEVRLQPSHPTPGQSVEAQVTATDPESDDVTFEYSWRVDGNRVDNSSSSLLVALGTQSIEVSVVAHDGHGKSDAVSGYAHVGNLAPSLLGVKLNPTNYVSAGNDVVATPSANDPEGDEVEYRYRWTVNGETLDVEGPTLPAKRIKRGDRIVLEVWATDGNSESEPIKSDAIQVVNAPPHIVSTPGAIGADGVFRYEVRAEDPDGDTSLHYRLVHGPEGMTIGFDDGKVVWTPKSDAAGTHPIEIAVEDRFGGSSSQSFEIRLAFQADSAPPPAAPSDETTPTTPKTQKIRKTQKTETSEEPQPES